MIQRVRNEVVIHWQLRHRAILELYHFFEDSQRVCLVMELCEGGELYRHLQRRGRPLKDDEVRRIFGSVVEGVVHLHARGIIHRDLKLSNILLTKSLQPKIADFGLAVRVGTGGGGEQQTICGTPNYLAPEILKRAPYGQAADVWSLGCLLYTLVCARPPFEAGGVRETLERASRAEYDLPRGVSPCVGDLIARLLVPDPNSRLALDAILHHSFMVPEPLSTVRLRPIKQRVRHGTIELMPDGQVCIDFASESHVCAISGALVVLRNRDSGSSQVLRYPDLPASVARIYDYAKRFVQLLRSKTPKVILASTHLRASLMESGDFQMRYGDTTHADYAVLADELVVASQGISRHFSKPLAMATDAIRPLAVRMVVAEFQDRFRQCQHACQRASPTAHIRCPFARPMVPWIMIAPQSGP